MAHQPLRRDPAWRSARLPGANGPIRDGPIAPAAAATRRALPRDSANSPPAICCRRSCDCQPRSDELIESRAGIVLVAFKLALRAVRLHAHQVITTRHVANLEVDPVCLLLIGRNA